MLVTLVSGVIFANLFELIVKRTAVNSNRSWTDSALHTRRVPAEWEPQEAVWVQWPGAYEKSYEKAFGSFACIILNYEKLHIAYHSNEVLLEARDALDAAGCRADHEQLSWHEIPNDNAWMRDNGPIFVEENGALRVQDWGFNAWGGRFGNDIPYLLDDQVPARVANYLGMPRDVVNIIHERGNLEFNGVDSVILNWSTLGDSARNPSYTQEQAKADLVHWFGVDKVVFIEGVPEGDLTNGHIDGIARFISADVVVVAQCTEDSLCSPGDGGTGSILDAAARIISDAGFKVIRDPIEGFATFKGQRFDANYLNWLVGNGFVITTGYDDELLDGRASTRLQGYFPGRDIYVLPMLGSWAAGGGVHCHTNDQPALVRQSP